MVEFAKSRGIFKRKQTEEQTTARNRMALFPHGEGVEVIYVAADMWVVRAFIPKFSFIENQ